MDGGWVLASLLLRGGRFPGKHKGATRSRFTERTEGLQFTAYPSCVPDEGRSRGANRPGRSQLRWECKGGPTAGPGFVACRLFSSHYQLPVHDKHPSGLDLQHTLTALV